MAAHAGLALGKTRRAILLVSIDETGKVREATVAVSSGDDRLDGVAIEYARTLDWQPAIVRGRNSSMSIRLPVIFAANS